MSLKSRAKTQERTHVIKCLGVALWNFYLSLHVLKSPEELYAREWNMFSSVVLEKFCASGMSKVHVLKKEDRI